MIVGYSMKTFLVEIKNPKTQYGRKGLNENQKTWFDEWKGGAYFLVDCVEAAIRALKVVSASTWDHGCYKWDRKINDFVDMK